MLDESSSTPPTPCHTTAPNLIPSILFTQSSQRNHTAAQTSSTPRQTCEAFNTALNAPINTTTDDAPPQPNGDTTTHNRPVGDTMALPKRPGTTRIYFQNINGIVVNNPSTWDPLSLDIQHLDLDISLWAEHNLDTQKPWVQNQLHTTACKRLGLGSYDLQTATPPVSSLNAYKPGGVLSLIHGPIQGRILERGQDPLGRWVYTKLRRNSGPSITIIVTYQVVNVDPTHSRPTTYATQLFAQYLHQGRPNPHKLQQHHTEDLVHLIRQLQLQGESIILAGDLNEELGMSSSGMTRLLRECHLVDPILQKHGHVEFSTYQRGTKVLDYILVDPTLLPHVVAAGYEPFGNHIISDHRGVYIDLDTARSFGSTIQPLLPLQLCDLSTKRSHQIAPYFHHKKQHLHDHAWFQRVTDLQRAMDQDHPNDALAEDLYNRLVLASQYAGKQLKRFPPAPYSPTISRLRQIRRFLKLELTQYKTGLDLSEQLRVTRAKLGNVGYSLPTSKSECEQMLQQCTRKLRTAISDETATKNLRD